MKMMKASVTTLLALFAGAALASPSVDKLTLNPAKDAKVGDKITVTVDIANVGDGMCGLEVEFGDGRRELVKIKPDTKVPIVFEQTYKKPGEFKVRAAGDRVENALGCSGKQIVMYTVAAAPAASAPAAAAGTAACPADWALKGKAAKDGSFTCVPKKGVKAPKKPEQPIVCPAGTSYFTKGKTLGCEKS